VTTGPTALIVPQGSVILQQPFIWSNDFFENQGRTTNDLLTLNLPKSDNIEWSVEVRPPKQTSPFALKANVTKTVASIRRSMSLQYTRGDNLLQLSSGNISSVMLSRSNLYLPGTDVDLTLSSPTINPSAATASLTTKVKPLGLSSNLDYDLSTGLVSGWVALYHALQHIQTGNKIGVGGKGEFVGNTLKAAQFGGSFRRNTFEAHAIANLTNLRTRPSSLSLSFFDTMGLSGRNYDVAAKFEHNLETERTTSSVAVLAKQLNSKFRINTNGLVGVASTHTFAGGDVSVTFGFDLDTVKKDSVSSIKITLV